MAMKAPISKQAEEIFKDPDKAQRLIRSDPLNA
jgi:hypothetical protein